MSPTQLCPGPTTVGVRRQITGIFSAEFNLAVTSREVVIEDGSGGEARDHYSHDQPLHDQCRGGVPLLADQGEERIMTTRTENEVRLSLPFAEAMERTRAALQAEGFGVLTTIDMQAAFREKLGAPFRPYVIMGACNPPLAYQALTASPEVGLMLPCNVTVEEEAPGLSVVRLAQPSRMLGPDLLEHPPALQQVASDAEARLARVADDLRRSAAG